MIDSRIQNDANLFLHNTLRMKSTAQNFFIAKSKEDLIEAVKHAHSHKIPLFIIGGGSNIALATKKVEGLVVRNLYMKSEIVKEDDKEVELKVSSGYPVTKLINENIEDGYSGLEFHLGLPGTVGGAIYMNSKWTKPVCYFGDPLISAEIIDKEGTIKTVERSYFDFAYDYSAIQKTGELVLDVIFKLKKIDPKTVAQNAKDAQEYRNTTQPHGVASSGCFFQNITEEEMKKIGVSTQSAGNLIDKSGLKGFKLGSFIVSPDHANFVINNGEGNPEDLVKLLELMRNKVKEKFGIELRHEVVVKN